MGKFCFCWHCNSMNKTGNNYCVECGAQIAYDLYVRLDDDPKFILKLMQGGHIRYG